MTAGRDEAVRSKQRPLERGVGELVLPAAPLRAPQLRQRASQQPLVIGALGELHRDLGERQRFLLVTLPNVGRGRFERGGGGRFLPDAGAGHQHEQHDHPCEGD